jgi:hypothetical protein
VLEVDVVSLASEFPNDNPALHRGVIWVNTEPTGAARPERTLLPIGSAQRESTALDGRERTAARAMSEEPTVPAEVTHAEAAAAPTGASPAQQDVETSASAEDAIELAPKHESLAPPEDDEIDESAGPIVVEELEPIIEASLEGELRDEDLSSETAPTGDAPVFVEGDEPSVADTAASAVAPETIVGADATIAAEAARAATETETVVNEVETIAEIAGPAANGADAETSAPMQSSDHSNDVAECAAPVPAHSEVVLSGTRADAHEDDAPLGALSPVFDEVVAGDVPRETTSLPPAPDDPFTVLVCTLADVAIAAGSPHVASLLPGLLFDGRLPEPLDAAAAEALRSAGLWDGNEVAPSFVAVTAAWRAILRGTSDDFDACGAAMLDEWAAELLARLLEAPARAPMFRQELRSRGVAAFGLAA